MPLNDEKITKSKSTTSRNSKVGLPNMSIVNLSTIVYTLMGSVGILIAVYGHNDLAKLIYTPATMDELFKDLGIVALSIGLLLVASYLFEDWFPSYGEMKKSVIELLGPTSIAAGIYLAFVSSFGEEMLFRAALLPYVGLFFSSVLFGLLHLNPETGFSAWTFWAFLAGLLLGWIYQSTNSIGVPVFVHFGVNAISILKIQYTYRKRQHDKESAQAALDSES